MTTRRPPIFGPEPWAERAGVAWSHWDLWFCLVCVLDADGDWDALENEVVARGRSGHVGSHTWEHKRSHLLDMRGRLDGAGLTVDDLTTESMHDKQLVAKARRKVLEQDLAGRDLTPPMENTPRRRLRERAYRGHWEYFPISPAESEDLFVGMFASRRGSFGIAMDLERIAKEEHELLRDEPARRLALWRGLLTAGLDGFLHGLRDSDGAVATYLGEALAVYAKLDWRDTGIEPDVFWTDLCEWCIWEDWGILHQRETAPFLGAQKADVDIVASLLSDLEAEYRSHRLDYEADKAMELGVWLAVATRSFDRFVPAAGRLRADHWIPVHAMGEAATQAGKRDLAVDVYAAAIAGGGSHVEYLTRRCRELTGVEPSLPRLRLVD